MVVVGRAVLLVGGDVEEVGALDQAQVLEDEADLALALEPLRLRSSSRWVLVP